MCAKLVSGVLIKSVKSSCPIFVTVVVVVTALLWFCCIFTLLLSTIYYLTRINCNESHLANLEIQ